jgi:chromosome segregation ATPase
MASLFKTVLKVGVVGVVLLGTAGAATYLVAGAPRTKAVVRQVHDKVLARIDEAVEDPVALRAQLLELEKDYPRRIAQVRGDLAELNEEIRQLERDKAISQRVVELAEQDLARIEPRLEEARTASDTRDRNGLAPVAMGADPAVRSQLTSRIGQIRHTRAAYANRAADAAHDLGYLRQQSGRLEELLLTLENERAQFRTQIQQLSRQVDAIARNDRLIDLLEKRNQTIEECSRYQAVSLDQVTGRLAEIRCRQEAELDLLAKAHERTDYEDVARMQLAEEEASDATEPTEAAASVRSAPWAASAYER